jgi:iron complex outermembrane receptor protein
VIRVSSFISLAVLLLCVPVAAQTGGTIQGTVRDITGAPLAGARVEVTVGGRSRSVRADSIGLYRFDGLPPGTYRVVARHLGLAPVTADVGITDTARAITVDLTLGTVVASEVVSVAAVAPGAALDTPTAAGSRLALTARETPATLNVMTFSEAQSRGLATTTDALARVPGVTSANLPATFATSIRGFAGAAISTLFDGTRSTTSSMVMRNFDSWNFDRIEVLKGPASVLYGEGALAGAVNFVAKRPDFARRRGEALISFGSLQNGRAAFGSTGPLGSGDRAAYRLDGVFSGGGGWVDDTEVSALNVSGAVDVKLSPAVMLSVSVDHFRDDYQTTYWGTPLVPAGVARDASDVITDSRGFVLDRAMREVNFEVNDGINQSYGTWLRGRVDWRLAGSWRLTNESYAYDALREWKNADGYGFDASRRLVTRAATSITHDHRFYGNRLTLAADHRIGDRRNRLSVGVEATRNTFFMPRRFGTSTAVDPFAPARGAFPAETPANFPGAGSFVDFDTALTLVSVFAEDALTIAPRVTIVGGGRLDRFDVDRRVDDLNTGVQTEFGRLFTPASGRLGAVVDVVDKTQLFAQVTTAVAPVSTVPIISQSNARFDLTTGRSWETGVKSTLGQGRVEVTAAAFGVVQDDILTRDPNNANLTIQGGRQSSRGVEITAAAIPTPAIRIDAYASLMRVQFDELIEAGGANRAGNVPSNVPERTAGFWASYSFSTWPLTIGAGVHGRGRFFTNNANTIQVASYAVLDAQASWALGPGDVTLRGKNLTDTFYADWAWTANQVLIGMPRMVEATYRFRF